jgi:hypothetical protein
MWLLFGIVVNVVGAVLLVRRMRATHKAVTEQFDEARAEIGRAMGREMDWYRDAIAALHGYASTIRLAVTSLAQVPDPARHRELFRRLTRKRHAVIERLHPTKSGIPGWASEVVYKRGHRADLQLHGSVSDFEDALLAGSISVAELEKASDTAQYLAAELQRSYPNPFRP